MSAQTNLAYNALDVHVKHGWGGHTALIYLNERGERQLFTYAKLLHDVEKIAAALCELVRSIRWSSQDSEKKR